MRVIAKRPLRVFWERHPAAREPLRAWFREVERADWDTPAAVKARYPAASIVGDDRVVFNVKGNAYRLVVRIRYELRIVCVRFVGTHADCDAVDVEKV